MASKLKLGSLLDDKPVRLTVELPAAVHRDLVAYAEVLGRETGQANEPAKLIAPMLARFMASDRAFAKARRGANVSPPNQVASNFGAQPSSGATLANEAEVPSPAGLTPVEPTS